MSRWQPKELPRIRERLVKDVADFMPGTFASFLGTGRQNVWPPMLRNREGVTIKEAADLMAAEEVERLRAARLYYVSEEMTALALSAGRTLPSFLYDPTTTPPNPCGLMFFDGAPLLTYEESILPAPMRADSDLPAPGEPTLPTDLVVVGWGPCEDPDGARGTWFSVYSDGPAAFAHMLRLGYLPNTQQAHDYWAATHSAPLSYDNEWIMWEGTETSALANMRSTNTTARCAEPVLAAWLLMGEPFATPEVQRPQPKERRRLARNGQASGDVHVVKLRRPAGAPEGTTKGTGEAREWSCSWLVGGHWRRQWYPSSGTHRPRYIAPYLKGDPDKPLRVRETVAVWDR